MIKRILIFIVGLVAISFVFIWFLSGGMQNVRAAVNHFRNPFQYDSIIDYFFQIGSTTGETFKLPGAPENVPTLDIPNPGATSTADYDATNTRYDNGQ